MAFGYPGVPSPVHAGEVRHFGDEDLHHQQLGLVGAGTSEQGINRGQHLAGLTFDIGGRVTENLRASLAYAYTNTSVPPARNPFPASANCPACGTIQPVYIIYTPEHAASASLDYTVPMSFADLKFHLDANFATGTQSFEQSAGCLLVGRPTDRTRSTRRPGGRRSIRVGLDVHSDRPPIASSA